MEVETSEAERLCISSSLNKPQGVPEKGLIETDVYDTRASQTQEIIKHIRLQSEERDMLRRDIALLRTNSFNQSLRTASGSLQGNDIILIGQNSNDFNYVTRHCSS